jgi:hypothetical protein
MRSTALLIAFGCIATSFSHGAAAESPPGGNPSPPATCALAGPLVRIPSRAAADGLVVRISPPAKPRYAAGAPIAVHMLAASPNVSGSIGCASSDGFIDVGFLCPGAEYRAPDGTTWRSGGAERADQAHWERCVEPLADVLAFATGRTRSLEGKPLAAYSVVTPLTKNAGVIGWSFGGNMAVHAMARYGERFRDLKWYASWETPITSPVDDGRGTVLAPNPFYHPDTDTIEFDRLRYSTELPVRPWPLLGIRPTDAWPRGGLYLDGDGNGAFEAGKDFAFWADMDPDPPVKAYYPLLVTKESFARGVFGTVWPAHIATVEELEERERRVNALRQISAARRKLPKLAVLVFESEQHHVRGSGSAKHSDAILQVNAWLDAKVRWVRFNPDVHYLEQTMGREPVRRIQCPAMQRLAPATITDWLEPTEASFSIGMRAAVAELADRTQLRKWSPQLDNVLMASHIP